MHVPRTGPDDRKDDSTVESAANLILLAVAALLLFSLLSRTRRQQKAFLETQSAVAPGREVMTASGLYGRVVEVDGDIVVLETAPGQRSRWAKQAIGRVLPEEAADGGSSADPRADEA